jgi:TadE-like protein
MRTRGRLAAFLGASEGASAVEFALVVPLLLAIIFSTFEAGWLMTQTIMLDHSLDRTVRELRTGQLDGASSAAVKTRICNGALVLVNCEASLTLEMIPIRTSADYPTDNARCINRAVTIAPVLRYTAGARSEQVFVRACFVVSALTPLLSAGLGLPQDGTGAYRIVAKSAFANEP